MSVLDLVRAELAVVASWPDWAILLSKATVFLALAWVAHLALARGNPRWRVLLWRGAVIGLALLAIWKIGLPVWEVSIAVPQTETVALASPENVDAVGASTLPEPFPGDVPDLAEFSVSSLENRRSMAPTVPDTAVPASGALPWTAILAGTWGTGVAILLIRFVMGYLQLRRFLASLDDVPDWIEAEVRGIGATVSQSRKVEVRSSRDYAVPFVCGFRRPLLVLPERMCRESCRGQLRGVVAHEMAHVASSDFRWNVLMELATIVLWMHPLAWRMGAAHRAACDAVCDAVSATYLGDVRAYCRTLAEVALEAAAAGPSIGLAMAGTCNVRRRIAKLQQKVFSTAIGRRAVWGFVVTGLTGLALLAGLRFALAEVAVTETKESDALHTMQASAIEAEQGQLVTSEGWDTSHSGQIRIGDTVDKTNTQNMIPAVIPMTPEEIAFSSDPGSPIGGVIHDEEGKPIAEANVSIRGMKSFPDESRFEIWLDYTVKTNAKGLWISHPMPKDPNLLDVTVTVKHPDYKTLEHKNLKGALLADLREQKAVFVLRKGHVVSGTVTDANGVPVAGALVGRFDDRFGLISAETTTDKHGRYRLSPCDGGDYQLAVSAAGFGPSSKLVHVTPDAREFDLQLRIGASIRVKVVDQDGTPLSGANANACADQNLAFLEDRRQVLSGQTRNQHTNSEGRWSTLWIPGVKRAIAISKEGYETVIQDLAPSDHERVIMLRAATWSVAGRVVDEQTKAPITSFQVVFGVADPQTRELSFWHDSREVANPDGEYFVKWSQEFAHDVVRIEADGHYASGPISVGGANREVTFDVELRKGPNVVGVVRSPDGGAVADAEVALCTAGRGQHLTYARNGRPRFGNPFSTAKTGGEGQFTFPPQSEPYVLIAIHNLGFAQVADDVGTPEIILQPWARLEGTLRIGDKPGANETVKINFDELWRRPILSLTPMERIRRLIIHDYRTKTDAGGRFVFAYLPPGEAVVSRHVESIQGKVSKRGTLRESKSIALVAGQTRTVELINSNEEE